MAVLWPMLTLLALPFLTLYYTHVASVNQIKKGTSSLALIVLLYLVVAPVMLVCTLVMAVVYYAILILNY